MPNIFVRPVNGARVRQPDRGHALLPEEGALVVKSGYWLRRLADGEVEEISNPLPDPAAGEAPSDGASAAPPFEG